MNDQALRERFRRLPNSASGPDLEAALTRLSQGGLIRRDGDAWVVTELGKSFLQRLVSNPS